MPSPVVRSHECLENQKTDNDGLHEKEDGVELMIAFSSDQACEIERALTKYAGPKARKWGRLSATNRRHRPA
jgi:hypothetical protein